MLFGLGGGPWHVGAALPCHAHQPAMRTMRRFAHQASKTTYWGLRVGYDAFTCILWTWGP